MRRGSAVLDGRVLYLVFAMLALLMAWALVFTTSVRAQEATAGEATARAGDSTSGATATAGDATAKGEDDASVKAQAGDADGPLVFAEGGQTAGAQAAATTQQVGPLAGTRVETTSTDADPQVETIFIPGPTCTAKQDASFVLEDEDGTQAAFIDNDNVQIEEDRGGLEVTDNPPGDNIVPLNVRGGDDVLDTGGLTVVTSTDIQCGGAGNNAGGNTNTGNTNTGNTNTGNTNTGTNTGTGGTGNNGVQTPTDDGAIVVISAAEDQYGKDDVIVSSIPDKKVLADTGGMPLPGLLIAGLGLAAAGVALFRFAGRD